MLRFWIVTRIPDSTTLVRHWTTDRHQEKKRLWLFPHNNTKLFHAIPPLSSAPTHHGNGVPEQLPSPHHTLVPTPTSTGAGPGLSHTPARTTNCVLNSMFGSIRIEPPHTLPCCMLSRNCSAMRWWRHTTRARKPSTR